MVGIIALYSEVVYGMHLAAFGVAVIHLQILQLSRPCVRRLVAVESHCSDYAVVIVIDIHYYFVSLFILKNSEPLFLYGEVRKRSVLDADRACLSIYGEYRYRIALKVYLRGSYLTVAVIVFSGILLRAARIHALFTDEVLIILTSVCYCLGVQKVFPYLFP